MNNQIADATITDTCPNCAGNFATGTCTCACRTTEDVGYAETEPTIAEYRADRLVLLTEIGELREELRAKADRILELERALASVDEEAVVDAIESLRRRVVALEQAAQVRR